jgi:4-aminobutyrate aminotransferase-like enzyme/Ser/Thr protein kinase RdoA (MazF antagonist)
METTAIDPLRSPPPLFDVLEAAGIARRVFCMEGSLTALPSERDLNFRLVDERGRSFLLKIQNPADDIAVVEMQTEAILHVERQAPDLPVMRLVPTPDGDHWAAVSGRDGRPSLVRVFTFLEGHNPATEELDHGALRAWGSTVARLGRALRGFFHPAANYPILWDLGRASMLRPLVAHVRSERQRAVVERVLDRFAANVAPVLGGLRAQVVHNDMSLDNVLVGDHGRITGITDFGDMTHTALVCDLAVTLSDVLDGRPDALDVAGSMIDGYQSVTPLEDAEAAVLGDLVATRSAIAMVISAWRLDLYPENAAYVSTFGEGAWRLLELFDAEEFDLVGRRFRDMCMHRGLPYRPVASDELRERRRKAMGSAPLSYWRPLHLVRGEGVWMFDPQGRRYLDVYNNVPVVGHSHPRVIGAVAGQTRALNTNTRYLHEAVVELAERLLATMPSEARFDRVLFVNSGSEANDVAWRIARWATGRRGAIVTEFAYHGVTEATADLSPEEWPDGYAPEHVATVPAPDGYRGRSRREQPDWERAYAGDVADAAVALERRGTPVAAMFVDPAFTSDGILCPPSHYFREAAGALREAGGLLVADEVQPGYGRYGDVMWSFQAAGLAPDFVTTGKPMGNGFPVAAVVTRADVVDQFAQRTGFFSTFGGNPVACAAALAVLDVIRDEEVMANVADVGAYLIGRLTELASRHAAIGDVRGRGLMVGIELVKDRSTRQPAAETARAVVNGLRERGVLIGSTGPAENVLKIRPPLVFGREHADLLVEALDEALYAARAAFKTGSSSNK